MLKHAQAQTEVADTASSCTFARQQGIFLVTVTGDLDFSAAEHAPFTTALSSYRSDEPLDVVLDVGGVTFLDSSGLSWLMAVRSAAALANRRVRLRCSSPLVDKVLEMAGLTRYFPAEARAL